MAHRGAHAIAGLTPPLTPRQTPRLTKRDVEALLDGYDSDPVGALSAALRKVLDAPPDATWTELVPLTSLPETTRVALLAGDTAALDALAAQLNESRTLR